MPKRSVLGVGGVEPIVSLRGISIALLAICADQKCDVSRAPLLKLTRPSYDYELADWLDRLHYQELNLGPLASLYECIPELDEMTTG